MELWIRSQNKKELIKADKIICNNYPDDCDLGKCYIGTDHWTNCENYKLLGVYETNERALEVLDEIQKYLTPTIQMLDETIGDKKVCQVGNIMTFVYEMPKE